MVWAADTADSDDIEAQGDAIREAFEATRAVAPDAAIAHLVPTGHNGRDDWPRWADLTR